MKQIFIFFYLIGSSCFLFSSSAFSQNIENVKLRYEYGVLYFNYDLNSRWKPYKVKLSCIPGDHNRYSILSRSHCFPGKDKELHWLPEENYAFMKHDSVQFIITAIPRRAPLLLAGYNQYWAKSDCDVFSLKFSIIRNSQGAYFSYQTGYNFGHHSISGGFLQRITGSLYGYAGIGLGDMGYIYDDQYSGGFYYKGTYYAFKYDMYETEKLTDIEPEFGIIKVFRWFYFDVGGSIIINKKSDIFGKDFMLGIGLVL